MAELTGLSETDASNPSISGANVAEGCAFSGINDAIRNLAGMVSRGYNRLTGKYPSTGSPNAYLLTPTATLPAYVTGERYSFRASFSNTATASLNISGLGAKTIKKFTPSGKVDLAVNDIRSGQAVTVEYDGTDMLMVTPTATTLDNITNLTEDTTPDLTADFVATYDTSASAHKKVKLSNLVTTGTFTPTLISASGGTNPTVTYGTQSGRYTRIGNRVFVDITLTITAHSSGTGNPGLGGLPLTANASALKGAGAVATVNGVTLTTNYTEFGLYVQPNTTTAFFRQHGSGQSTANLAFADIAQSFTLEASIVYEV